jgi:aminopeptidase N
MGNTAGRPTFHYKLQQKNGIITSLSIGQRGKEKSYWLPQAFDLVLVYTNKVERVSVNMNRMNVEVKEATGKNVPLYILFNSSGQGYGLFPVDSSITKRALGNSIITMNDPLMRASCYINWYENMLEGRYWRSKELIDAYLNIIAWEKEELNLNMVATQFTDIFWRLIPPSGRDALAAKAEAILWGLILKEKVPNNAKILFKTFQSIALTGANLDTLYSIWKHQQAPGKVILTEDDYTALALSLTVKAHKDTGILKEQGKRISNIDRKNRLLFLEPALSADVTTRDAFFRSLKDLNVRKRESWVAEGVAYLHHPLRATTSIKYLKEGLEMLGEIGATGDIFFPAAWLNSMLGQYRSSEAATIVRSFLKNNPRYNVRLKAKILQAADPLFRAEKLSK